MSRVMDEDVIRKILSKPVSELTEEDKAILREWFLKHRSKYSIAVDLRRASKKVPVYTATWFYKPGRYDIPGVDTPEALPQYQKLGYKPKHRKTRKEERKTITIEMVSNKLKEIILNSPFHRFEIKNFKVYNDKEKGAYITYYEKNSKEGASISLIIAPDNKVALLIFPSSKKIKGYLAPLPLWFNSLEELYRELEKPESKIANLIRHLGAIYTTSALYTELRETGNVSYLSLKSAIEHLKEYHIPIPEKVNQETTEIKPSTAETAREKTRTFADVLYALHKATEEAEYPFKVDKSRKLGDVFGWRYGIITVARALEHNDKWNVYEDEKTITVKKLTEPNEFDSVVIVKNKDGYDLYYHKFGTIYYESPFVKHVKTKEEAIKEAKRLLSFNPSTPEKPKPEQEEYEKLTENLRLYNPPYSNPPSELREKAKQYINKLLKKHGLDQYEVFEDALSGRKFIREGNTGTLYYWIIEAWIRGWNPEELIKRLKPIAKSYTEYHRNIEEGIKMRTAINKYTSNIEEWIKKYGKKSGWRLLGSTEYSDGAVDLKLEKYDPETGAVEYYAVVHIKPTEINGEKKILMDVMFSKDKDRFLGEQSIQYIYTPEELEKEEVTKILAGSFLGDYMLLEGLKKHSNTIVEPKKALEHLKKNHVYISPETEEKIKEWINKIEKTTAVQLKREGKLVENLPEFINVSMFNKYFPEVLEYVKKGYKIFRRNFPSLFSEIARQMIREQYSPYELKYVNIDEATKEFMENVIETAEKEHRDPVIVALEKMYYVDIVPLLYFIGKGYYDVKSLRSLSREYIDKLKKVFKDYYIDNAEKVLRSTKLLSKALPMLFNIELLTSTHVGKKVLSSTKGSSLYDILHLLYEEDRDYHGRMRGYRARPYTELIKYLTDKYTILIEREHAKSDINYLKKLFTGFMRGKLNYDGIRFDIIEENGKPYFIVYENGKPLVKKEFLFSMYDFYHPIAEIEDNLRNVIEELKAKGYIVVVNVKRKDKTTPPSVDNIFIAKIKEGGVEVLYPEHKFYSWSDESFIKNYNKHPFIEAKFKEFALKHGISYPSITGGVRVILKNKRPYLEIVEGYDKDGNKKYTLLYKGKSGWGGYNIYTIEAPTLEKLLKDAMTTLPPRYIEILKKHLGIKVEEMPLAIMKAIGETLTPTEIEYEGEAEHLYINGNRTVALFKGRTKLIDKMKHHYTREDLGKIKFYIKIPVYNEEEKEDLIKKLQKIGITNYQYSKDEASLKIYINNKLSISRLKKALGSRYISSPDSTDVTVETPDGIKNKYYYLLHILTRVGIPEEIWTDKDAPIIMKYDGWYLAIAPYIP